MTLLQITNMSLTLLTFGVTNAFCIWIVIRREGLRLSDLIDYATSHFSFMIINIIGWTLSLVFIGIAFHYNSFRLFFATFVVIASVQMLTWVEIAIRSKKTD